jgi:hypothetical protein
LWDLPPNLSNSLLPNNAAYLGGRRGFLGCGRFSAKIGIIQGKVGWLVILGAMKWKRASQITAHLIEK